MLGLLSFFHQLGEPPVNTLTGIPSCNPHTDPPIYGDCWYNCTLDDISGEDKRHRLRKVLILKFFMLPSSNCCALAREFMIKQKH